MEEDAEETGELDSERVSAIQSVSYDNVCGGTGRISGSGRLYALFCHYNDCE